MSVSRSAVIVVGLPYEEIKNGEALVDDDVLQVFSPYYDAERSHCVAGFEYCTAAESGYTELAQLDPGKVAVLQKQFRDLTGQTAKVYLTIDTI